VEEGGGQDLSTEGVEKLVENLVENWPKLAKMKGFDSMH
jgi:hypothetical protein